MSVLSILDFIKACIDGSIEELDEEIVYDFLVSHKLIFGHNQTTRSSDFAKPGMIVANKFGLDIINPQIIIDSFKKAFFLIMNTITQKDSMLVLLDSKAWVDEDMKGGIFKSVSEFTGRAYWVKKWVNGMITNFHSISQDAQRAQQMKQEIKEVQGSNLKNRSKRIKSMELQFEKKMKQIEGVMEMKRLPSCLISTSAFLNQNALKEACDRNIFTISIVDSNASFKYVKCPIVCNDDSFESVHVVCSFLNYTFSKIQQQV